MKHIKGNAINIMLQTPHSVLFHQVNCQGVMGSGLALEIKKRFPKHYQDYKEHCTFGSCLGENVVTYIAGTNKVVVGVFGQEDYGKGERHTNYSALIIGISNEIQRMRYTVSYTKRVYILPKYIGCGLGGGDWAIVEQLLLDLEKVHNIELICVEYEGELK
jgi:O-acetyl-ADP-ribose deacetylase (regulator of RNase III)